MRGAEGEGKIGKMGDRGEGGEGWAEREWGGGGLERGRGGEKGGGEREEGGGEREGAGGGWRRRRKSVTVAAEWTHTMSRKF